MVGFVILEVSGSEGKWEWGGGGAAEGGERVGAVNVVVLCGGLPAEVFISV